MDIYKEVKKEMEQERQNSFKIREFRKSQVYEDFPKIKEIDDKISNLSLKISFALLKENHIFDSSELEGLSIRIKSLEKEKREILSISYPEDYLDVKYNCILCEDNGHVNSIRCKCVQKRIVDKYLKISGIKKILENQNFENFDFKYFSDKIDEKTGNSPKKRMEIIYKSALDFVNNFEDKYQNLLFFGDAGLGKTFLCNCIAKELIYRDFPVFYTSSIDMFKNIENLKFEKSEKSKVIVDLYYKSKLLIIDDLGTEFSTIITISEFFSIVNTRIIQKLPTIISTNLTFDKISEIYSDRISSRIVGEYKIFKFIGDDIRKLRKLKNL
ncbi:MAG: ATP-binding protein [Defluviitaleaceae bacterium]|nr:ATP-binding protein [Defluviitaleaceae bacterium]